MNRIITFLVSVSIASIGAMAQSWVQKAGIDGEGRWGTCEFSIGDRGYVIGGRAGTSNDLNENLVYDVNTNSWEVRTPIPTGRRMATAFSINGKGYVTCGALGGSVFLGDLWEYDADQDSWTQRASLPDAGRYGAAGFVINDIGYIVGGNMGTATGPYTTQTWAYDPATDQWTEKTAFPGLPRYASRAFVVDGKAYVSGGRVSDQTYANDLWMYDPLADNWTEMTSLPANGRCHSRGWNTMDRGLICGGHDPNSWFQECWSFNPAIDAWSPIVSYPGAGESFGTSLLIGDRIFAGLGMSSVTGVGTTDLWELRDGFVGIDQPEVASFQLIPNPCISGGEITVALSDRIDRAEEFILHNSLGQVVYRYVIGPSAVGSLQLPIPELAEGSYTASLLENGNAIAHSTIMIISH